jgi:biotin carboxyl carrier protein
VSARRPYRATAKRAPTSPRWSLASQEIGRYSHALPGSEKHPDSALPVVPAPEPSVAATENDERREVRVLRRSPAAVILVGTRVLRAATVPAEVRAASRAAAPHLASGGTTADGSLGSRKQKSGRVTAPMPGRIVTVAVKTGATVQAGEVLLVIEAMKMQNELLAPSAGTIAKVAVAAGEAVERGALLVEIA